MQARVSPSTSEPTIFLMRNTTRPPLSDDDKQEFGQLLLLDRLMQYENALADDREVADTCDELEEQEKVLKGKFFRSDEEDFELEQVQQDLVAARQAREETAQALKDAGGEGYAEALKAAVAVLGGEFHDPLLLGKALAGCTAANM